MQTPTPPKSGAAELIAQVVAWHNRDPLAQRISASQVTGIGVVALPVAAQAGRKRSQALFSEDLIAPLKASAIANFAGRHGSRQPPGGDDWPRREVAVDPRHAGAASEFRFLGTAAIEGDGRRTRVLVGDGPRPRILGRRLPNRGRSIAALAAAAVIAVGATVAVAGFVATDEVRPPAAAPDTTAVTARSAPAMPGTTTADGSRQSAAAGAAALGTAAIGPLPPVASATPATPATPAASAASATIVAAADPVDRHRAAPARVAANGASGPASPAPAVHRDPPAPTRPAAAATHASAAKTAVYALASVSTSTRQAADLRIGLMNLPTEPAADRPHAEVMRVEGRWRVVIWPFASRDDAEALRKALAAQGMPTELIAF